MPRVGQVRIGISGWTYPRWRGVFYPPGLVQRRELEHASAIFSSVEVNGSFYSLLRPAAVARWREQTPPGFVFAVKGSRFITHMKKLRGVETALANFFASGLLAFEEKLGPILWQLPPQQRFDADRLAAFFAQLPRSTAEAAALARHHDHRVEGRALTEARVDQPMRHALEIRHESFRDPAFVALLREHRVALCAADTAGLYPLLEDLTADFAYVRLHGDAQLYTSGYGPQAIAAWARKIAAWRRGAQPEGAQLAAGGQPARRGPRDVYVYFDNDAKVHAPFDAQALAGRVARDEAQ